MNLYKLPTPNPRPLTYPYIFFRQIVQNRISHLVIYVQIGREIALLYIYSTISVVAKSLWAQVLLDHVFLFGKLII